MKNLTLADYYFGTWWLLIFIAFLLLASSHALPHSSSILGFMACYWVVSPTFIRNRKIPRASWLVLFIILITCWVRAGFSLLHEGKAVQLICGFFVGLLPLFLKRGQKSFGIWMGFLVLSLLAIISVVFTNELFEYAFFLIYLVILLLHLNAANLYETSGITAAQFMRLPKNHLGHFIPSLSWGLLLAAMVFFFFPRKPSIRNPFGIRGYAEQSGYTGSVSLKSQSQIAPVHVLAMMVESNDPTWLQKNGPSLYFRGNTLDHFEGKDWSLSNPGTKDFVPGMDIRHSNSYDIGAKRLKIYREPHGTRGVIYPGVLLEIQAPTNLIGGLSVDYSGNLTRGHSEVIRYSYEVLISPTVPPLNLNEVKISEVKGLFSENSDNRVPLAVRRKLSAALQMPAFVDQENYLTRWVQEVGVDPEKMSVPQVIERLRRNFFQKFRPSLAYKLSSENGMEAFLSKDRQGHCEYFATAAALFLRAIGIPSRLALGYRGGRFNPVSKALEVYEHSAHAWVEYFFPGVGWITFDPTPLSDLEEPAQWKKSMEQYIGAAKFWANRYLVDYNDSTQRQLVKTLATSKTYGIVSWKSPKLVMPSRGFLLFVIAVLIVIGRLFWRITRKSVARTSRLPTLYRDFIRVLDRQGFRRGSSETFREFHQRLIREGMPSDLVGRMDKFLEQRIYAKAVKETPEESAEFKSAILKIRPLRS